MNDLTVRKAAIHDVRFMHKLINDYAGRGMMLPRPLGELYETVREFFIAERDGEPIGCAGLQVIWEDLAEVKSLAVRKDHVGKGAGKMLLQACLSEAKTLGLKRVFALTYAADFFRRQGFADIDKDELPHKVWTACIQCPKFPDCDEKALAFNLE